MYIREEPKYKAVVDAWIHTFNKDCEFTYFDKNNNPMLFIDSSNFLL